MADVELVICKSTTTSLVHHTGKTCLPSRAAYLELLHAMQGGLGRGTLEQKRKHGFPRLTWMCGPADRHAPGTHTVAHCQLVVLVEGKGTGQE